MLMGLICLLKLAYNYGVAFSMFSFLEHNLKYIQLAIVLIGTLYLFKNKEVFKEYYLPIALLICRWFIKYFR
jgi:signal peptidase II